MTATRDLSGDESESARRRRMYSASLGFMCGVRLLRSERNEEVLEGIVEPGTMDSLLMVASSPRVSVDERRFWRAVWSSWDAVYGISMRAGVWYEGWLYQ